LNGVKIKITHSIAPVNFHALIFFRDFGAI